MRNISVEISTFLLIFPMHVNKHDTTILDEIVRETDATRKDAYHISVYIYIYIPTQ